MADEFVSYSRSDKACVAPVVAAIEAKDRTVWWDPPIDAGQQFDDQSDAELQAASVVLVVWTPTSVVSRRVRGEARDAAEHGTPVPVRFEDARLPIDVRAIQTMAIAWLNHAQADPDLDPLRDDPCFKAMVAAAETRLAAPNDGCAAPGA